MKKRHLFFLISSLFIGNGFAQDNKIYKPFDIAAQVGFDVLHLKDYSRPYSNNSFRTVQVALWFPIKENKKKPILLKDYLDLYLNEDNQKLPDKEAVLRNEEFWSTQFKSLNENAPTQKLLNTRMLAVEQNISVLKKSKKLPLIIYAAGGQGESFENAVLCEFVASKGFVVAAIPSIGTEQHEMNTDLKGLNSQIRDMELVINGLSEFTAIDLENIGLIGWSWGGLAAMGLQTQNKNIKAVTSLDGSIAGYREVVEQLPGYDISRIDVPYLFMATDESTVERVKKYFNSINYSDATLLSFSKIDHNNFSGYGYLASSYGDSIHVNKQFYPLLTRITARFFENHLKKEHTDGLKPLIAEHEDFISLFKQQEGLPSPPSEAEFIELIASDGIERGKQKYLEIKERDSAYILFQAFELTKLAFKFARDSERKNQAIPIMQLVLREYPKSYSSYALKARIHEILEEDVDALLNFGKAYGLALELAPYKPGEETVFYEDLTWYQDKIEKLKEKLVNQ